MVGVSIFGACALRLLFVVTQCRIRLQSENAACIATQYFFLDIGRQI